MWLLGASSANPFISVVCGSVDGEKLSTVNGSTSGGRFAESHACEFGRAPHRLMHRLSSEFALVGNLGEARSAELVFGEPLRVSLG